MKKPTASPLLLPFSNSVSHNHTKGIDITRSDPDDDVAKNSIVLTADKFCVQFC